jgi:hypothetical protein
VKSSSLIEKLRANQCIADARRTIVLGRLRCLSFDTLLHRLRNVLTNEEAYDIIYAVIERPRSEEEDRALAAALVDLLATADRTPARRREWLDRQIGRILSTLPRELSQPIAREFLLDRRKSRRTIGFHCLSLDSIDDELSILFLRGFDETGDDRFLKALLRQPLRLNCVDPRRLIDAFNGDDYWVMRVVEATLREDRTAGLSLAAAFPASFVWAVGRLGDPDLLPEISRCFKTANDKLNLVGIVAWAYGKLGAYDQLEDLSCLLDELAKEYEIAQCGDQPL